MLIGVFSFLVWMKTKQPANRGDWQAARLEVDDEGKFALVI